MENPTSMKTLKISQSLMKDLISYFKKETCGYLLKARYFDGLQIKPSEAMDIGNWFEYKCTGQLPRNGEVPEPRLLKSGKLSTPYARMEEQIENYHKGIKEHGFEIVSSGHIFTKNKIGTGIADLIARKDGKLCIIDIKTTSLFNDKWSETGWDTGSLEYKDRLLIQAVQYSWLAREEFNEDVDFYFMVFNSKNGKEYKILKINLDEDRLVTHQHYVEQAREKLKEELKSGFKAHPSYLRCYDCQLKDDCSKRVDVPKIEQIYY